jgi:hypothetical protein
MWKKDVANQEVGGRGDVRRRGYSPKRKDKDGQSNGAENGRCAQQYLMPSALMKTYSVYIWTGYSSENSPQE